MIRFMLPSKEREFNTVQIYGASFLKPCQLIAEGYRLWEDKANTFLKSLFFYVFLSYKIYGIKRDYLCHT